MSEAPRRLRVDHISAPQGVSGEELSLSWWSGDARDGETQSGYQVQAASRADMLSAEPGHPDLWDTDLVAGRYRSGIPYDGRLPGEGSPVFWRVRTYDAEGIASPWSELSEFLIAPSLDHNATHWIAAPIQGSRSQGGAVPILRRSFELSEPVHGALLTLAALGMVRVEVNGLSVPDLAFAPGWNSFADRTMSRSADISKHLRVGTNTIAVYLGDGYYAGAIDGRTREHYGARPALKARLICRLAGDLNVEVSTDARWQWRASDRLSSDVVLGEHIDARRFDAGFSQPDYDAGDWWPAELVAEEPRVVPSARPLARILETIQLAPLLRSLPPADSGLRRWRADLGEVIFGQVRVTLNAQPGEFLRTKTAVRLDDSGEPVFVSGDSYTTSGVEGESFAPLFSQRAFRWVEIEGDVSPDSITMMTASRVGAGLADASTFECDHRYLNEYFGNCRRTLDVLLQDHPLGSVGGTMPVGDYRRLLPVIRVLPQLVDSAAYLRGWVDELIAHQLPDGGLPAQVPRVRQGPGSAHVGSPGRPAQPGLPDVAIKAGWVAYRAYDDWALLSRTYEFACRALRGIEAACPDLIRAVDGFDRDTSPDLIGTALFFESARLATRMAGVLGRLGEMEEHDGLSRRIASAFRRRFVTPDGAIVSDTVSAYVLALNLGLLEAPERGAALALLEEKVRDQGFRHSADPLLADRLLDVLVSEGRLDIAYALLMQTGAQSWLHPVLDGARNTPSADGETPLDFAGLAALGFLFEHVVGLRVDPSISEDGNAYRHVRIAPQPPQGELFPEGSPLSSVSATFDTLQGRYGVRWEASSDHFKLVVTVPCGCEAEVVLPDGDRRTVTAGKHELVVPLTTEDDGIPVLQDTLTR